MSISPDNPERNTYGVEISVPIEGDLAELEKESEQKGEVFTTFAAACQNAAARKLAEHPVTITATLEDGSTVTHVYRFAPVEDFERAYAENQKAFHAYLDDPNAAQDENATFTEPNPLFTIEQLS